MHRWMTLLPLQQSRGNEYNHQQQRVGAICIPHIRRQPKEQAL
jgi:hypothetical protein